MTSSEIAALLEQAAEFPDESWTQGAYARDEQNNPVHWDHPSAVRFCAAGRLFKVTEKLSDSPDLYYAVAHKLPGYPLNLGGWNDHPRRTPEQVRQLFRKTAARLREQGE